MYIYIKKITTSAIVLALLFSAISPIAATAASQPPQIITYQGRLTDSGGNLLGGTGTSYYFKFSIWDSATVGAGNRLWPSSLPSVVTSNVKQGVFTVNIGDTANGYPDTLNLNFSNNSSLYLQVEVSSDNVTFETLSPRQQLTSSVFSQVSGAVVGSTAPSSFGTSTPATNSFVTIAATSSSSIPLTIVGANGQTSNVFQIQNNLFQNLFSIAANGAVSLAQALGISSGGTGATSFSLGQPVFYNGTSLVSSSTLAVNIGGTGATTFTSNGILFGNGTGGIQATAAAANAILVTNGSNIPSFSTTLPAYTLGGAVTGNGQNISGVNQISATAASSTTLFGGIHTGNTAFFGATATSSFAANGALTLSTALTLANGGTGASTQQAALNSIAPSPTRAGDLIYYNGSNWLSLAGNNTGTQVLQENSLGLPSWAVSSGSGTVNSGLLGQISYYGANGTVVSGSSNLTIQSIGASSTALSVFNSALFGATATSSFSSTGALALATALTVPNGGTGAGTFTLNGVLFGNNSGVLQATAAAANAILVTNGSNIPSFSTTLPAHTLGGAVTGNGQNITGLNLLTATAATSTSLFGGIFSANTASFGQTATSTFGANGALTLSNNLTFSNAALALLPQGTYSALNFATSSSATPILSLASINNSASGAVGIGTSTPWGKFSVEMGPLHPAFVVANNGSSTPSFIISGVNQNGTVGIGTSSPYASLSVHTSNGNTNTTVFAIGSSTAVANTTLFSVSNTGTTTIANGVNITSGCFSVNGTCIGNIVKLRSIFATSTPGTVSVVYTGAVGSAASFSAGTLTLPSDMSYAVVEGWGGGGGGGAEITNAGTAGGTTCFASGISACTTPGNGATWSAGGGGGGAGTAGAGGVGGTTNNVGNIIINGAAGVAGNALTANGGAGGDSPKGGQGGPAPSGSTQSVGISPGGGGSGGRSGTTGVGAGGGGGAYTQALITTKNGANYAVGSGGSGGVAGTTAGGAGAPGEIVIYVYATTLGGSDVAENYPTNDPSVTSGEIVDFDNKNPEFIKRAVENDGSPLAGIISTQPGVLLGDKNAIGQRSVALSGRVPTNVNLENGPINVGDRITLSSVPGTGKKANLFDASVGIALTSFDGGADGESSGKVDVFINLQPGLDVTALTQLLLGTSTVPTSATATSTATSTLMGTTTPQTGFDFIGSVFASIIARLQNFGIYISDTLVRITNLATDHLTVGSESVSSGITVYDKHGQIGCLVIEDVTVGTMRLVPGACATQDTNTASETVVSSTNVQATTSETNAVATSSATVPGISTSTTSVAATLLVPLIENSAASSTVFQNESDTNSPIISN